MAIVTVMAEIDVFASSTDLEWLRGLGRHDS